MPIPFLWKVFDEGLDSIPYLSFLLIKVAPWVAVLYFVKSYFSGARNTSERLMHGKVIMITVCTLLPRFRPP